MDKNSNSESHEFEPLAVYHYNDNNFLSRALSFNLAAVLQRYLQEYIVDHTSVDIEMNIHVGQSRHWNRHRRYINCFSQKKQTDLSRSFRDLQVDFKPPKHNESCRRATNSCDTRNPRLWTTMDHQRRIRSQWNYSRNSRKPFGQKESFWAIYYTFLIFWINSPIKTRNQTVLVSFWKHFTWNYQNRGKLASVLALVTTFVRLRLLSITEENR